MVLDRATGAVTHRRFADLPSLLAPGDLVLVNDSKVLRARLFGKKADTGGRVEILLVEPVDRGRHRWKAMLGASKPVRTPSRIVLDQGSVIEVVGDEGDGFFVVELPGPAAALTAEAGRLPLPPYLRRDAEALDDERYQTIFARDAAAESVAAPTAGLHFTPALTRTLATRGISTACLTLHVGPGTFLPVRVDRIEDHRMHAERYEIPAPTVAQIDDARVRGGRLVAVGTTVTRVLESQPPRIVPVAGSTEVFIRPGHAFRHVDVMLTNFHLPRSTLLMLVSAFGGYDAVMAAYAEAVAEGYRFFSYGDAMLIL